MILTLSSSALIVYISVIMSYTIYFACPPVCPVQVLARWLLLWLRARKLPKMTDEDILTFLFQGTNSGAAVIKLVKSLSDEHAKLLNLGHDWLKSYLPFVLQKINRYVKHIRFRLFIINFVIVYPRLRHSMVKRVHFGLLHPQDIALLEEEGFRIPTTRKLVAVPFVAKDVPSKASEFAHPDVLIGVTILAYRYEGLRVNDFNLVIRHLRECMDDESGPYRDRPACQRFEQWVLSAGKIIRGSKKREKGKRRARAADANLLDLAGGGSAVSAAAFSRHKKQVNSVFTDIFCEEDDAIWPLQLIDVRDQEQFKVLYPLIQKLPHSVMYYLNELIFPEALKHQV